MEWWNATNDIRPTAQGWHTVLLYDHPHNTNIGSAFTLTLKPKGVPTEIDNGKRRFQTISIQQDPEDAESVVEVFEPELKLTSNNDPLNPFASGTEMTTTQLTRMKANTIR